MPSQLLPDYEPSFSQKGNDLALFAHNDREVFFFWISDAVDSLARQYAKGIYDPYLALRSFQYIAKKAALVYERAFGDEDAALKHKITCFTPEEVEEAGHRLLLMNEAMLEEAIRNTLRREGGRYE